MGTAVAVAVMYCSLTFLLTAVDLFGKTSPDDVGIQILNLATLLSGGNLVAGTDLGYLGSLSFYYDLLPTDAGTSAMLFLTIGFLLMVLGIASPASRNFKGPAEDPQEFLFTHRPLAIVKCLLIPWNSLATFWSFKKAPVIIPIAFLPFIAPFALVADLLLLAVFLLEWLVMTAKISFAFKKDRETYESHTQYAVCPKCKMNFYQPLVKCQCGLVMKYPVPNVYGVRFHTCNNGHKILSTGEGRSRSKIQSVCPYCKKEIQTREAKPIVVSMVGASGSGKTTIMLSAVDGICSKAKEKGIISEPASKGLSPAAVAARASVIPTVSGETDSEFLFMRSRELSEKELIVNDISGLEFEPDRDKSLFEEYYRYNDGIVFAIDPLAVVAVYNSQSPTKSSKATPVNVLESFYNMYTEINGYGPSVRSTVPLAVVMTKMDDPRVASAVNAEKTPEAFLAKYGQDAFVKIAGTAFENTKYFKVASLGQSQNALDPFAWILASNDDDLKQIL
jgi:GTPase SAR1 family protein